MDFSASFALIAPELLLTAAGLVLLLVAAWDGDKSARLIAIAAAAALFGAGSWWCRGCISAWRAPRHWRSAG